MTTCLSFESPSVPFFALSLFSAEKGSSRESFFEYLAAFPPSARLATPTSSEAATELDCVAAVLEVALASLPTEPGSSDAWVTIALPIAHYEFPANESSSVTRPSSSDTSPRSSPCSASSEASASSSAGDVEEIGWPPDKRSEHLNLSASASDSEAPPSARLPALPPSDPLLLSSVASQLGRRSALLSLLPVDLEHVQCDLADLLLKRNGRGWQDWAEPGDGVAATDVVPNLKDSRSHPRLNPPPPFLALVDPAWRFALNANFAAWTAKRLERVAAALEEQRAERELTADEAGKASQGGSGGLHSPISATPSLRLPPATFVSQFPFASQMQPSTSRSRRRAKTVSFPPEACRWDQLQRLSEWRSLPGTRGFGRRAVSGRVALVILPRVSEGARREELPSVDTDPSHRSVALPHSSSSPEAPSTEPPLVLHVRMYPFIEASASTFAPPSAWVDEQTGASLQTRSDLVDEETGQSLEAWARYPGARGALVKSQESRRVESTEAQRRSFVKSEDEPSEKGNGMAFWGGTDGPREHLAEPSAKDSPSLSFWSVYPSRADARTKQAALAHSCPRVAMPRGAPKGAHGDAWPGLRLLGFRRRRSLKPWMGMGGVRLVFPDVEDDVEDQSRAVGSGASDREGKGDAEAKRTPVAGRNPANPIDASPTEPTRAKGAAPSTTSPSGLLLSPAENATAFFAIHAAMLRTKTYALVESKRTQASPPRLGALVARKERRSTNGLFQLSPPCLLLVPLPYAEEVRAPEADAAFTGGVPPPPPSIAIERLGDALERFRIDDLALDLEVGDPQANRAAEALECAVRGLAVDDEVADDTLAAGQSSHGESGREPSEPAGLALFEPELVGDARPDGKGGVGEDRGDIKAKRARAGAGPLSGARREAPSAPDAQTGEATPRNPSEERLLELWRSNALTTLTVAELRAELSNRSLPRSGNKGQLIDRLSWHFAQDA